MLFRVWIKTVELCPARKRDAVLPGEILNDFNLSKAVLTQLFFNSQCLVISDLQRDPRSRPQESHRLRNKGRIGIQTIFTAIKSESGIMIDHLRTEALQNAAADVGRIADDVIEFLFVSDGCQ